MTNSLPYDIPAIITTAIPLYLTRAYIQANLISTGIYPINMNLFQENNLKPSFVTGRPKLKDVVAPSQNNIALDDGIPLLSINE